jgi:hypothetical protein
VSRSAGGGRDLGERHVARHSFNEGPIGRADAVKDDRFRREGPAGRDDREESASLRPASFLAMASG